MDKAALSKLRYPEIQRLAKTHGIRAKGKQEKIVDALLRRFGGGPVPVPVPVEQEAKTTTEDDGDDDDDEEVAPELAPAEPEAAVNQASQVETREEHSEPFRFTFEHRWMAPSVCAARSTMCPMPSSPRPRFQPADFSRNSKYDVPASPSTDSMGSSSVRGSPDRRGDMRGGEYGQQGETFLPQREDERYVDSWEASTSTGNVAVPRPYIFGPRAVDASESISQCRPRQWTAAAYGQEEIGEASYRRPRRDEVQRVDADLREKAREAVAMAKEMGDLEKGVDEMEASKKRIQIAVKKVQAFRTVLELHFGRENLEKVGDEMQGARGARRLYGRGKHAGAGVQGCERPNKRRRTGAA